MDTILAAIGAHLGYAFGDVFVAKSSRKLKALPSSFWVVVFNVIIFAPLIFFFRGSVSHFSVTNISVTLLLALLLNASFLSFNKALGSGNAPLVGAISGSFPALVVIFSLIFFHEAITLLQAIIICFVLIGIVVSSLDFKQKLTNISSSVKYAFLTLMGWGIYFTLVKIPVQQISWFWVHYLTNLSGIVFFGVILILAKQKAKPQQAKHLYLPAIAALLTGGATLLFNFALGAGKSSVVAPIAGSYPALFAILAYIVFKEKLTKQQVVGIIITLTSVIALSFISI